MRGKRIRFKKEGTLCKKMHNVLFFIKQKPPAMPVDKRKTTQALAAERSRYTKKLLCAKLNVRLATVHK